MKEYRTEEQWGEVCESAVNGNWQEAGQECVEYGFWANDMINAYEVNDGGLEPTDLALLAEEAMQVRMDGTSSV